MSFCENHGDVAFGFGAEWFIDELNPAEEGNTAVWVEKRLRVVRAWSHRLRLCLNLTCKAGYNVLGHHQDSEGQVRKMHADHVEVGETCGT